MVQRISIDLPGHEEVGAKYGYASACRAGDILFVSGTTGLNADGTLASDPRQQFEKIFEKLGGVLEAAGADWSQVVEIICYHVGLQEHLDVFTEVRKAYFDPPYPACTGIGVAELALPGMLAEVQLRVYLGK